MMEAAYVLYIQYMYTVLAGAGENALTCFSNLRIATCRNLKSHLLGRIRLFARDEHQIPDLEITIGMWRQGWVFERAHAPCLFLMTPVPCGGPVHTPCIFLSGLLFWSPAARLLISRFPTGVLESVAGDASSSAMISCSEQKSVFVCPCLDHASRGRALPIQVGLG
jgi:hypothetical protein